MTPFFIQHRGAPDADLTLQNTAHGALLSIEDLDSDGLEVDVLYRAETWLVGHPPGPTESLDGWLDAVGPALRAGGKLLLLDLKGPVDARSAAGLRVAVERAGLNGQVVYASFNDHRQLDPLLDAESPVALFVHRDPGPGRFSIDQAFGYLDGWRGRRRMDVRLVLRWHRGPLSRGQLERCLSGTQARSTAGDTWALWFSGLGTPGRAAAFQEASRGLVLPEPSVVIADRGR